LKKRPDLISQGPVGSGSGGCFLEKCRVRVTSARKKEKGGLCSMRGPESLSGLRNGGACELLKRPRKVGECGKMKKANSILFNFMELSAGRRRYSSCLRKEGHGD